MPMVPQRCALIARIVCRASPAAASCSAALARGAARPRCAGRARDAAFDLERAARAPRRCVATTRTPAALPPRLQQLLQPRLGVLAERARVDGRRAAGRRPARTARARRLVAAVEEHRAEHRLERVGEDRRRRCRRSPSRSCARAGPSSLRRPRPACPRAPGSRAAGQLAFGQLRKALVELVGDRAVEHAVAEELEPLVVVRAVAAMGQRLREQARVGEPVPSRSRAAAYRAVVSCEFAAKSMYRLTLAEQRHFLAVGEREHDLVAFARDLEVVRLDRSDVVDRRRDARTRAGCRPLRRSARSRAIASIAFLTVRNSMYGRNHLEARAARRRSASPSTISSPIMLTPRCALLHVAPSLILSGTSRSARARSS